MNFGKSAGSTGTTSPTTVLGPYEDDGARRMPDPVTALEAARKRRSSTVAGSGRESTRLSRRPGTTPYTNSFLGQAS